jgi:hypothetical protein
MEGRIFYLLNEIARKNLICFNIEILHSDPGILYKTESYLPEFLVESPFSVMSPEPCDVLSALRSVKLFLLLLLGCEIN